VDLSGTRQKHDRQEKELMKKLIGLTLVMVVALPILAGCGEKSETVNSSEQVIQVDSSGKKKGAMENDKGLYN
jgi:hypothetical protein